MNAPGLVADAATLALGVAIIGVLAGAWWSALRAHDARKRDATNEVLVETVARLKIDL